MLKSEGEEKANMFDQDEVLAFLGSSRAFDGDSPVQRVETHGAYIFMAGGLALKLKRAVRYDYMDLSTVNRRHRMLQRELELNIRAAPGIYRDIQPITREAEGLRIGGAGQVVDWVLRMNRFASDDELDVIADRGGVDDALAAELGRVLWRYHMAAPLRDADGAKLIEAILDELDRVFAGYPDAAGTAALLSWQTRVREVFAEIAPFLRERGADGHIRRGHGDLHLRNIVLIDGHPVPFDVLEFDETLGTCDVLYDLGFLLMDLEHRGLGRAANQVLCAYLLAAYGAEDAGLLALPLFLSVRAAIRAMVLLQTDQARNMPGASGAEIATYLADALRMLEPPPLRLIGIGGLSGTGKTVLARALAPGIGARPGAIHLSSDAERKAVVGLATDQHMPGHEYSSQARGKIYDRLMIRAETLLRAGHSVIMDATFMDEERRMELLRLGAKYQVDTSGIWLEAPAEQLELRVAERRKDASDADVDVLRHQLDATVGRMAWNRLNSSGSELEVLRTAQKMLARIDE